MKRILISIGLALVAFVIGALCIHTPLEKKSEERAEAPKKKFPYYKDSKGQIHYRYHIPESCKDEFERVRPYRPSTLELTGAVIDYISAVLIAEENLRTGKIPGNNGSYRQSYY